MSRRFDSACFMVKNMRGLRRNNSLVIFQAGCNNREVGLRTADKEIYAGFRSLASLANQITGMIRMRVKSISRILLQISLANRFQYRQRRSLQIITFKSYHLYSSSFISWAFFLRFSAYLSQRQSSCRPDPPHWQTGLRFLQSCRAARPDNESFRQNSSR